MVVIVGCPVVVNHDLDPILSHFEVDLLNEVFGEVVETLRLYHRLVVNQDIVKTIIFEILCLKPNLVGPPQNYGAIVYRDVRLYCVLAHFPQFIDFKIMTNLQEVENDLNLICAFLAWTLQTLILGRL